MKDILLKIKAGYELKIEKCTDKDLSMGLCYICLFHLESMEYAKFKAYFNSYLKRTKQKVFFNCYGVKTKDKDQFAWNPQDTQSRLNWLDEQITLNEK